jgi:capsular exopolysaccharide family
MKIVTVKKEKLDYRAEEAFKSLRTNIQFCGEDKKVIVITSSMPSEGKSSVSLNLAVSLTEVGKRVLFIDADLRKSMLAGRLKAIGRIQGLTHFLSRQEELDKIVYETDISNLRLILAGAVPPNPAELLGGVLFDEMLAKVRQEYDYVIIDTPPLGSVIDSAVIARKCDGAILVIESDAISYRFVQSVKQQLSKSGCPILGAVLNKVDFNANVKYGKYYGEYRDESEESIKLEAEVASELTNESVSEMTVGDL